MISHRERIHICNKLLNQEAKIPVDELEMLNIVKITPLGLSPHEDYADLVTLGELISPETIRAMLQRCLTTLLEDETA